MQLGGQAGFGAREQLLPDLVSTYWKRRTEIGGEEGRGSEQPLYGKVQELTKTGTVVVVVVVI